MTKIVGSYKLLPEDPDIKPAVLKERLIKALPEDMEVKASGESPVAFGLVALIVDIHFDEEDGKVAFLLLDEGQRGESM